MKQVLITTTVCIVWYNRKNEIIAQQFYSLIYSIEFVYCSNQKNKIE